MPLEIKQTPQLVTILTTQRKVRAILGRESAKETCLLNVRRGWRYGGCGTDRGRIRGDDGIGGDIGVVLVVLIRRPHNIMSASLTDTS